MSDWPQPAATIQSTYATRPAAGTQGRYWVATDSLISAYDTGSAWSEYAFGQPITDGPWPSTWVNQGGSTSDTTKGGLRLLVPESVSGISVLTGLSISVPYTVTVMMLPNLDDYANPTAGICLYDGSAKLISFGPIGNQNNQPTLGNLYWTNATTYSATGQNFSTALLGAAPIWLQVSNDGTHRHYLWSTNGIDFIEIDPDFEAYNYFLTETKIGMFCSGSGTATHPYEGAWFLSVTT